MRSLVSMVISLTVISTICGVALGGLNAVTAPIIEEQSLRNLQVPAVELALPDARNDLLEDRVTLEVGEDELVLFPARREPGGEPYAVAFQQVGTGYKPGLGVVVAIDPTKNQVAGIAVSSHAETPGLGARAKEEPFLRDQFRGLPLETTFALKQDGGGIDAISGATTTSRGVCKAVTDAVAFYREHEEEIRRLVSGSGEGGGR